MGFDWILFWDLDAGKSEGFSSVPAEREEGDEEGYIVRRGASYTREDVNGGGQLEDR